MQGRKKPVGWLIFFLFFLIISITTLLLGLLTPSWQVVYLEEGRTEHLHGLWLDCKRDYSYDYGRPREYYETLHRRFDLSHPFYQFWFPALNCVFKFDYWLDEEDWYEYGYDENRLWGDAYQHLFLGWKIAALASNLLAAVCALFAIVALIFSFCHRLCTCVAAVLVVISLLSSTAGNLLFFMFAMDQDNYVIKEEDGIYQQHFGWSFWTSLLSNILMLVCSISGCVATKASFSKNRSTTKFVKLQLSNLNENDESGAQLLSHFSGKIASTAQTSICSQQEPKREFASRRPSSPIYKIESQQLREWERDTMRSIKNKSHAQQQQQNCSKFKQPQRSLYIQSPAAASSTTATAPAAADVVYEYVDWNAYSSGRGGGDYGNNITTSKNNNKTTPLIKRVNGGISSENHLYDPVPMVPESTPFSVGQTNKNQTTHLSMFATGNNADYLRPKSLGSDNSTISTKIEDRKTPSSVDAMMRNELIKTGFSTPLQNQQQQRQILFEGVSNFGVETPAILSTRRTIQFPLFTGSVPKSESTKNVRLQEEFFEKMPKVSFATDKLMEKKQQIGCTKPFVRSRSSHRLYHAASPPSTMQNDVRRPSFVDDHHRSTMQMRTFRQESPEKKINSKTIGRVPSEMDRSIGHSRTGSSSLLFAPSSTSLAKPKNIFSDFQKSDSFARRNDKINSASSPQSNADKDQRNENEWTDV